MARKKPAAEPVVEPEVEAAPPAKTKKPKKKAKAPVKLTAAKKAYQLALDSLVDGHMLYSQGKAEDDDFPSPAKQRKVAKQIAKLHNRLLSKSKLDGLELDEDPSAD